MKTAILIAVIVGCASALPQFPAQQQQRSKYADIYNIRSDNDNKEDGNFQWSYENSDGSSARQTGYVKNAQDPNPDNHIQAMEGAYSYISPEGENIQVTYTADENGFQAQGAHLPTPPPIPEAIQKALEIIYRNAAAQQQRGNQNQNQQQNNNFRG